MPDEVMPLPPSIPPSISTCAALTFFGIGGRLITRRLIAHPNGAVRKASDIEDYRSEEP
jgi:hypothetical protein